MNRETIIRAWKDPTYRASLTPEEREALPECPSGTPMTDLGEDELAAAVGGYYDTEDICPRTWTAPTSFTTNTHLVANLRDSVVLQGGLRAI